MATILKGVYTRDIVVLYGPNVETEMKRDTSIPVRGTYSLHPPYSLHPTLLIAKALVLQFTLCLLCQ